MTLSRRKVLSSIASAAGAAAILPALAACGGTQGAATSAPAVKFGDPVSITFWHTQTGNNDKAIQELVSKFNSANGKNITLKAEYQGSYTQVYQKIMAAIQAGSPPDVAVAYESMVADYMKANAVVDLEDYAIKGQSAFTKDSLNDIFPQYLDSNRYDAFNGKLLSFPFTKSLAVNYYNEDLLRAAGITKFTNWTFDEFKKAVQATAKKDSSGNPTVYGTHITLDTSYIDQFFYANGGELLTKDKTKVRFNEPPCVEVFDMWGQFAKDKTGYNAKGFDYQSDFGQAKVANVQQSSTGLPFFRDEVEKGAKAKWGVGLEPQKDPSKPVTVLFGGNVTVFKTTPLKQAASWEWVKFFTDKDQTVTWALKSGYMPLRKSAADNADMKQYFTQFPQYKQAFDLTQYAKAEPNIQAWQDIRDILTDALTAVLTGKATAKAALDEAANKANKTLDEKR